MATVSRPNSALSPQDVVEMVQLTFYLKITCVISAGDSENSGTSNSDARSPLVGSVMILAAQLIVACQMITEQKFISQYDVPPLQVCIYSVFSFVGVFLLVCFCLFYGS